MTLREFLTEYPATYALIDDDKEVMVLYIRSKTLEILNYDSQSPSFVILLDQEIVENEGLVICRDSQRKEHRITFCNLVPVGPSRRVAF